MDISCSSIRERLAELAGSTAELAAAEAAHLSGCASCRLLAADERRLAALLDAAVPPADPDLEGRIMGSIAPRLRRRRWLAALPVAASFGLTALAALVVGGIPGSSLLASLPTAGGHAVVELSRSAGDWAIALAATSRAARHVLPLPLEATALVVALLGALSVARLSSRWRVLSPWRPDR